MSSWNSLSMAQRAEVMKLAVQNGIRDLDTIRGAYNEFAKGGDIHIDPSKKGTFTAAASRHNMGVQEFASKVLANKDDYSSTMIKKANFARNASKWKHEFGGNLFDIGGDKNTPRTTGGAGYIPPMGDVHQLITADNFFDASKIRKKLYDGIYPGNYDNVFSRVSRALAGEKAVKDGDISYGDDLFAEYLQIPKEERHNVKTLIVEDSPYRPTKGDSPNIKYKRVKLPEETKDFLIKGTEAFKIGQSGTNSELQDTYSNISKSNKSFEDRYTNGSYSISDAFGRYNVGRGYDEKGEYRSIADVYDLNPWAPNPYAFSDKNPILSFFLGNKGDVSFGIGKPIHLYDRIYLDDYYGVSEPTHSTYLPEVVVTGKKHRFGGNLFEGGGDTGDAPNIFRRPDGSYFYSADGAETDVTPINILGDNPAYWTYTDAAGKTYTPKATPERHDTLTEAEDVDPLARIANNYFRELAWRAKNDPSSIALQGKYTMPLVLSPLAAPLVETAVGSAPAAARALLTPGSSFWTNPITQQMAASTLGGMAVDAATKMFTPYDSWGEGISDVVNKTTGWNPQESWWGSVLTDMTNPGYLTPYGAIEKGTIQAAETVGKGAALAVENYRYPLGRPQVPEGYLTLKPQTRTMMGDVEIDNPNLLYHLDRGDGSGAFSNHGAYVADGFLMPGTPKDASAVPYSWWNKGKPFAMGVNGKPMTRLMTATEDAPGMTHIQSQNYRIGQWDGRRGLVRNSEYVNPEGVDVSGSTYTLDPDYGWRRVFAEDVPTVEWADAAGLSEGKQIESLVPRYNAFAEFYGYDTVPEGASVQQAEEIIRQGLKQHNTFYRGLDVPEDRSAINKVLGKEATDEEVLEYMARHGSRDPNNTYFSPDERAAQYTRNGHVAVVTRKYNLGEDPSTWLDDADFVYGTDPATTMAPIGKVNYPWAGPSIEKAPPGEVRINPEDYNFEGWLPNQSWEYGTYVPAKNFKGSKNLYFNESAGHTKPKFKNGGLKNSVK